MLVYLNKMLVVELSGHEFVVTTFVLLLQALDVDSVPVAHVAVL